MTEVLGATTSSPGSSVQVISTPADCAAAGWAVTMPEVMLVLRRANAVRITADIRCVAGFDRRFTNHLARWLVLSSVTRLSLIPLILFSFAIAACGADARSASGVVTGVDGDLNSVTSFTLRTDEGSELVLALDPFGDFDFPPPHLREHLVSLEPVAVMYRETDGFLVAIEIRDERSP